MNDAIITLVITATLLTFLALPLFIAVTIEIKAQAVIRVFLFGFLLIFKRKIVFDDLLKQSPDMSLLPIIKTVKVKKAEVREIVNVFDWKSVIFSQFCALLADTLTKTYRKKVTYNATYTDGVHSARCYFLFSVIPILTLQKVIQRGINNARATN